MDASIAYALAFLVVMVILMIVVSAFLKSQTLRELIPPGFMTSMGLLILTLLLSVSIGMNIALSPQSGIWMTIGAILMLMMLFYVAINPSALPDRTRLVFYALVVIVVMAGIFATAKGWSWIAILLIAAVFVGLYFAYRSKGVDESLKVEDENAHWMVFFLIAGTVISTIMSIVQVFQPFWDKASRGKKIPVGLQVVAFSLLVIALIVCILLGVLKKE